MTDARQAPQDADFDPISAAFVDHETQLRRRTIWLSLIPVAVGVLVMAAAWLRVSGARAELAAIEKNREVLSEEIAELEEQRAELEKSISERETLIDHLQERLPADEKQAVSYIQTGLRSGAENDYGKALEEYGKALAIDARNAVTLNYQGYAFYRKGEYQNAAEALERAIRIDPELAEAYYNLAFVYSKLDRQEDAVRAMNRAFRLDPAAEVRARRDPDYRPIWSYRSRLTGQASAASEGEAELIERGRQAVVKRLYPEAIAAYREALKLSPDNKTVLNWLGYAYYLNGQLEEAIASLERAVALDPKFVEGHYNLGLAQTRAGATDAARESFATAFALEPAFQARALQDPQYRRARKVIESENDS